LQSYGRAIPDPYYLQGPTLPAGTRGDAYTLFNPKPRLIGEKPQ